MVSPPCAFLTSPCIAARAAPRTRAVTAFAPSQCCPSAPRLACRRMTRAPISASLPPASPGTGSAGMTREQVTELVVHRRMHKSMSWAELAEVVGGSKEWTTSALLGQQAMSKEEAEKAGQALDLPEEAVKLLQYPPYKGCLPTAVPTDPLVYRLYEVLGVYGTTVKELIHEEFGDGIMSAIDFSLKVEREPDPAGDRVNVTLNGKFLPYKKF